MDEFEKKIGILFVCTGNICRSPTADGIFRSLTEKAGIRHRFHIDSAGTHGYHVGDPPDPRAIAVAEAQGVDLSDLRARQIAPEDFSRFDHIFAMDQSHFMGLEKLKSRHSNAKATLRYFMDERGPVRDVPDPYYGRQKDFEAVYAMIYQRCLTLLPGLSA